MSNNAAHGCAIQAAWQQNLTAKLCCALKTGHGASYYEEFRKPEMIQSSTTWSIKPCMHIFGYLFFDTHWLRQLLAWICFSFGFACHNGALKEEATPSASLLPHHATLEDFAKKFLLVFRKSLHRRFGGGWCYLIFSYLLSLTFTDFTVIHDSELIVGHKLENYINSPTHHTLHHMYSNCNFGQFFTWTDKFFLTFRNPNSDDKSRFHSTHRKSGVKNSHSLLEKESNSFHPSPTWITFTNIKPSPPKFTFTGNIIFAGKRTRRIFELFRKQRQEEEEGTFLFVALAC
ncbi:C-5 sterol desaturase [Puccinia sorghi]|uniref:C-5 sterol desaturase n=1 Tax=Puccinia sorghi TaxID=27349 RepID=A0A0L6V1B6_9BASI|nr:C-5 sterol desaturase [Puccinia sorghi]